MLNPNSWCWNSRFWLFPPNQPTISPLLLHENWHFMAIYLGNLDEFLDFSPIVVFTKSSPPSNVLISITGTTGASAPSVDQSCARQRFTCPTAALKAWATTNKQRPGAGEILSKLECNMLCLSLCIYIYVYCDWCHNGSQLKNPSQTRPTAKGSANPFSPRQTNVFGKDARVSNVVSKLGWALHDPAQNELHQQCRPRQKHNGSSTRTLPPAQGCLSPNVSTARAGVALRGVEHVEASSESEELGVPLDIYTIHTPKTSTFCLFCLSCAWL